MGVARKLYLVRRKDFSRHWGMEEDRPHGDGRIDGAFEDREDAEGFREQCERLARFYDLRPLYDQLSSACLLKLTDFEPPIFADYLADLNISSPPPSDRRWGEDGKDCWLGWLLELAPHQLAGLYAGLHKLALFEVVEIGWIEGEYGPDLWEDWERAPGQIVPPDEGPAEDDLPF
jgi:hypothetical protein